MKNDFAKAFCLVAAFSCTECSCVLLSNPKALDEDNVSNLLVDDSFDMLTDEVANRVIKWNSVGDMRLVVESFLELIPEECRCFSLKGRSLSGDLLRTSILICDGTLEDEIFFAEGLLLPAILCKICKFFGMTVGEMAMAKYYFKALHGIAHWKAGVYCGSMDTNFSGIWRSILACIILSFKNSADNCYRNVHFANLLGMIHEEIDFIEYKIFTELLKADKIFPQREYCIAELNKIKFRNTPFASAAQLTEHVPLGRKKHMPHNHLPKEMSVKKD